jgi:hypothetical protein
MAHQFSSGVFCYNKPAWHRLGVVVDGTLSAREAFRMAKADFHVAGRPVFDADMQPIAGYQAITRMDTGRTLSVMTETYTPIQNDSLIRIAEALHEDINMDAVCVLSDGKKVTFTARIRGAEGDVVPGDPVQQYLVGCTSHDGSIPFQLCSHRSAWSARTHSQQLLVWLAANAIVIAAFALGTPRMPIACLQGCLNWLT